MTCTWCHNPESISFAPQLMYRSTKCTTCGACKATCFNGVHRIADGIRTMVQDCCAACGRCAEVCKSEALHMVGRRMTVSDIIADVKRDMRYYQTSGGGLTITGGEPMCQLVFTTELAKCAQAEGIGVVIETNGSAPYEDYEKLLPHIDLFFIDYKFTDSTVHFACTGLTNEAVLANISKLDAADAKMVLRCPIIPGLNDNAIHFQAIAALTKYHQGILGFEIMPYHSLGLEKARQLGQEISAFAVPKEETKQMWMQEIIAYGGREWRR